MTAVYTDPKRYQAATPVSYLSGEDVALYNGLGKVYFVPTTRKLNAMATFQLGLQLLHMFWYDLAITKFQQAQSLDPKLAMAYWGEAMCYKQPLWQAEDVAAAQAVLGRMDRMVPPDSVSEREQGYIDAARKLFQSNTSLEMRESQYSDAMLELYDDNQDDPDACAFAALSLLGQLQSLGNGPLGDIKVRYDAMELLDECTHYYPEHAGLMHYQVHLYDVPDLDLAQKGMAPSLALSAAARASNVAQHMRSHIFLRFGNWSEVVDSNKDAVAASDAYCKAVGGGSSCDADNRWHALEWELYGETQQCGMAAAAASYKRMQSVAASMNYSGDYGQWLYRSYAHLQLQSLGWLGAVPLMGAKDNATAMLPMPLYDTSGIQDAADISDHFWPPHAEAHALLARVSSLVLGRNATQQQAAGVNATVAAALARLGAIVAAQTALSTASNGSALNSEMTALLTTVQLQATALVAASACAANYTARCSEWVPLMDAAMALHSGFVNSSTLPSLKIAPTPELYGTLLLLPTNATNPAAAAALFATCLAQLPGRMQCVLGRARALDRSGDKAGARGAYTQLAAQCGSGDKAFPPLAEARGVLGMVPPPPSTGRG